MTPLAAWILVQILVPLRHFLIPGNVAWTAEGQRFAWHMKLNDTAGTVLFHVSDPRDGREKVRPEKSGKCEQPNGALKRSSRGRRYPRAAPDHHSHAAAR